VALPAHRDRGSPLLPLPAHTLPEITVRSVSYRNADVTVDAKLYLPPAPARIPRYCSCTGAGAGDDTTDAQVRRIVEHGFAVLAPDYHSPRFIPSWPETHDPATEKDVELGLDFLKTVREVNASRVCVVGISRGGYHAVLLAARRAEVACIVTYYGHMVNPNAPEPWQVYRYAPEIDRINVPALFIVGEEEFEVRRMGIRRAFYALLKRGVPAEIRMYPHARRAFDFRNDRAKRKNSQPGTQHYGRRSSCARHWAQQSNDGPPARRFSRKM